MIFNKGSNGTDTFSPSSSLIWGTSGNIKNAMTKRTVIIPPSVKNGNLNPLFKISDKLKKKFKHYKLINKIVYPNWYKIPPINGL